MRAFFHSRRLSPYLVLVATTVFVLFGIHNTHASDLRFSRVDLSKNQLTGSETIQVTYNLDADGTPHSAFNMGIFVAKGDNGKWLKKWGLPLNLFSQLKRGKTIAQTWSVQIPDWGQGQYTLSVHSDVDNFLRESNRQNNIIEKTLRMTQASSSPPINFGTIGSANRTAVSEPIYLTNGKMLKFNNTGLLKISYIDGSKLILNPSGQITPFGPDGKPLTPYSLQIPAGYMPLVPEEAGEWISQVQNDLFAIIEDQLGNEDIDKYLKLEEGKDSYNLILWRIAFIDLLLRTQE